MKPIHKFNGGKGATLCHTCRVIISVGLTDDLYCNKCNTMTAKEKALELIGKMGFSTGISMDAETNKFHSMYRNQYAKECALVAVDEIMSFMKKDDEESDTCYWANHPTLTYWQNVKQELDKM